MYLSKRIAEALHVAYFNGNVSFLYSTSPLSGGFKGMIRRMKGRKLLDQYGRITDLGVSCLRSYELHHQPLDPRVLPPPKPPAPPSP